MQSEKFNHPNYYKSESKMLKREKCIVYDKTTKKFSEVFELHPLENPKNEKYFQLIALTDKNNYLDKHYTLALLNKVSSHSLRDVATFYEVSKHTTRQFLKNKEEHDKWYEENLTSFWLIHINNKDNNATHISSLDYLELVGRERAIQRVFENFMVSPQDYDCVRAKTKNPAHEEMLAIAASSKSKPGQITGLKHIIRHVVETHHPDRHILAEKLEAIEYINPRVLKLLGDFMPEAYISQKKWKNLRYDKSTLEAEKDSINESRQDILLSSLYAVFNVCYWFNKYDPDKTNKDYAGIAYKDCDILSTIDRSHEWVVEQVEKFLQEKMESSKNKSFYLHASLELKMSHKENIKSLKI